MYPNVVRWNVVNTYQVHLFTGFIQFWYLFADFCLLGLCLCDNGELNSSITIVLILIWFSLSGHVCLIQFMCSAWSFIPGLDICYFSAIGITSSVVEDKCIVQFNEIFINRLSYKLFKSWYTMNYKPQRREELIVQIKTHYFLVTTALEYYNLKIHTLGCSWNSKLGEHLGTTHPLLYYFWEQVSMLPHQTFMGFW